MSSKTIKNKIQDITKEQVSKKRPINIKEIATPFSNLLENVKQSDIYSGNEKTPFSKRHLEYQTIFRYEFAGELRKFFRKQEEN